MAHTKRTITGNQNVPGQANTFSYSGSFDVFKASEVQVTLDNIVLTFTTGTIDESASPREYTVDYNGKTIHIGGATLTSSDNIVIQPVTDMGAPTPRATYEPGASVTSTDLNNNQLQLMRKAMEYNEQKLSSLGGTMSGNLHLGQNVDLTFEGDNNNTYETTLTVADPTADRTITFPDTTGTVVTTGDTGTVTSTMIANNTIVANDLATDSVTTNKILNEAVTSAKIANNAVTSDELAANSVDTSHLKANAVTTTDITDDAVTADKLANTSVTPGTYSATDLTVDAQGRITAASSGTIAGSEIAADAIDGTKIADDSINSEHYVDGSIDTAHIASGQITSALMAANSVNTDAYVDDSIEHVHLKNDIIDGDNIQDDVINSEHIAAGAVDLEHMSANSVDSDQYVDGSIERVHLEADIIDGTKLADDAVDSEHIVADSLDTEHYAPTSIDSAALASNAVTTNKITDSNVTTVKIADDNITLAKLASDLKQTSISNSDTQLPTSGAVVDYVAAQIAPLGGLEVIATDAAFPNVQPSSGVVISISDAGGVVFNGSGSSTTARTVGGSTVTINNAPSSLNNETLVAGVGLMVSSTGSSQTYNYHKILGKEDDIKQLSDDINDFNARYRVGSSNPTSALDGGDLFFNTTTGKLLVYNNTNTAWEEAQSIGNFFISTLSPAFDNSTQNFTLTNAPTNAQQLILSINGVIQKPNAGTSTPSEGFALDGSTVKLAAAPASGSDYFAIVMGSTVNIGTPSDGTVTAAKLTSGAVETAKIADGAVLGVKIASGSIDNSKIDGSAAIAGSKLADGGITTAKIAADAVDGTKIADDSIDSEHYADGSIDTAHISNDAITGLKIADDAIESEHYADTSIDTAHISNSAITTQKIADDAVTQAKVNFPVSNKNVVINGEFLVAQRATQETSVSGSPAFTYNTVDRFVYGRHTDAVVNLAQEDDAPVGFKKCLQVRVTTAGTDAGTNYGRIVYRLEYQDVYRFGFGQSGTRYLTLSFYHKHTQAGTNCVMIQNPGYNRSYIAEYTQSVANTWERAIITFPVDTGNHWSPSGGRGMQIQWALTDNDNQGSANTWTSSNVVVTTNQYNHLGAVDNYFRLTGIQLELGSVATDFEHRSYADELQRCKRYFNNFGATTATGTSATYMLIQGGYARFGSANSIALQRIFYDVEMRTTPTIKYGRNSTNDDFNVMRWSSAGTNPVVLLGSTEGSNKSGFQITRYNSDAGQTYNDGDCYTHQVAKFRADAEL